VTATPSLLRSKPLTVRTAMPRLVGVLGVEATMEIVRRCPDVLASTTLKNAWLALVEVRACQSGLKNRAARSHGRRLSKTDVIILS
jgi:hypothetical protein